MVKVYRDGKGKLYVRAKLSGFGESQHTFPCRKAHECEFCRGLPATNERAYAKEVGERLLAALRARRKVLPQDRSLTGTVKTVGEALARYRARRLRGRETLVKQEPTYKRLVDVFGGLQLEGAWLAARSFVDRYQDTGELRPASINRHLEMLKAAIRELYETRTESGARLIPDNYLSAFPLLDEQNIKYLILDETQMGKFWEALDPRLRPFCYFAWRVPIREGEAFNIRREHINQFSGLIQLPYGFTKNQEQRQIKILPEMEEYTRRFLASPADWYFNRGEAEGWAPMGYKDPQQGGRIIFSLDAHWKRAAAAAGAPAYNLHKTRQQAVMSLWADGWSEDEIMLFGGWKSRESFYHYFNREMALWIRQGQHAIDTSWKQSLCVNL